MLKSTHTGSGGGGGPDFFRGLLLSEDRVFTFPNLDPKALIFGQNRVEMTTYGSWIWGIEGPFLTEKILVLEQYLLLGDRYNMPFTEVFWELWGRYCTTENAFFLLSPSNISWKCRFQGHFSRFWQKSAVLGSKPSYPLLVVVTNRFLVKA